MSHSTGTCALKYIIHLTIVNDDSIVRTMMLQVVASPTIVIMTTPEVSFMLPENIYSTGVTYDCQNIFITQAADDRWNRVIELICEALKR
jgi:hypothetical protein